MQGWTAAAGVWAVPFAHSARASGTPLIHSHPLSTPGFTLGTWLLHPGVPKHQAGRRCPCPGQSRKTCIYRIQTWTHWWMLQKTTRTQSKQTTLLFTCYLSLLQRFLFVLKYWTGETRCFTAKGQFSYGLSCTQCLPEAAAAQQVLNTLFACWECLCLFLPEDLTFKPQGRPISHETVLQLRP